MASGTEAPTPAVRVAKYAESAPRTKRFARFGVASFVAGHSPLLRLAERIGQADPASLPELGAELRRLWEAAAELRSAMHYGATVEALKKKLQRQRDED